MLDSLDAQLIEDQLLAPWRQQLVFDQLRVERVEHRGAIGAHVHAVVGAFGRREPCAPRAQQGDAVVVARDRHVFQPVGARLKAERIGIDGIRGREVGEIRVHHGGERRRSVRGGRAARRDYEQGGKAHPKALHRKRIRWTLTRLLDWTFEKTRSRNATQARSHHVLCNGSSSVFSPLSYACRRPRRRSRPRRKRPPSRHRTRTRRCA